MSGVPRLGLQDGQEDLTNAFLIRMESLFLRTLKPIGVQKRLARQKT